VVVIRNDLVPKTTCGYILRHSVLIERQHLQCV